MTEEDEFTPSEYAMLDALAKLPQLPARIVPGTRISELASARVASRISRRRVFTLAIAASLSVVVGSAWFVDHQHRMKELTAVQHQLDLALRDLTVANRIQAIRTTADARDTSPEIVAALTNALLSDPNVSVRVASAEALGQVARLTDLLKAAARSLEHESSPFVHVALLRIADQLPPIRRTQLIKLILARKDLDPTVRAEAAAALTS